MCPHLPLISECSRGVRFIDRRGLLRQAEIQELDPLPGDQDVGGLQIPMGDAFLMRHVESIQNLCCVFDGLVER
jgi:hypothetical protein